MSVTRLQKFEKKFYCARVQSAVILLDLLCFNFIRAFNFDHMIGGISFLGSVLSVQYTVTLHYLARLAHKPYAGITYPINDDVTPKQCTLTNHNHDNDHCMLLLEKSKLLILALLYQSYLNMLKIEIKVKSTLRKRSPNLQIERSSVTFIERS